MDQVYTATIKTLAPETLRDWLKEGNQRLAVVDVRDSDYRYGRVRGAVNYPSKSLSNEAFDKLLREYPLEDNYKYVFHCMRSQMRGPAATKKFVRYLLLNTPLKDDPSRLPKVYLLEGGLKKWNRLYGNNPSLMETI